MICPKVSPLRWEDRLTPHRNVETLGDIRARSTDPLHRVGWISNPIVGSIGDLSGGEILRRRFGHGSCNAGLPIAKAEFYVVLGWSSRCIPIHTIHSSSASDVFAI